MNKQNAHLYLPLVQALAEGKTIEFQSTGDDKKWVEMVYVSFGPSPHKYRIKPESATVPLGPEDVPPGSAIRIKGRFEWYLALTTLKDHITFGRNGWFTYEALQKCCEIKRPGEDWKPCHKPA